MRPRKHGHLVPFDIFNKTIDVIDTLGEAYLKLNLP